MVPTKPLGVDLATAIEMEPQLKDIVTNPSNPDLPNTRATSRIAPFAAIVPKVAICDTASRP
jgi:hypothetical protein